MSSFSKSVLRGIAVSFGVILLICAVLATAEQYFDLSDTVLDITSVLILGIASFVASYAATQLYRSRGLLQGILCGASIFLIVFLLSIAFGEFEFKDATIIKAIICVLAGVVGGVKGVNTKKTGVRH